MQEVKIGMHASMLSRCLLYSLLAVSKCLAQVPLAELVASGTAGPGNGPQPYQPAVDLYNGTFDFQAYPGGSQQAIYFDKEIPVPYYAPTGSFVQIVNLTACGTSLPHFHPGVTEINYVLEGDGLIGGIFLSDALGNRATWATGVSTGGVLAIPANNVHYAENPGCGNVSVVQVFSGLTIGSEYLPYIDLPTDLLAQSAKLMQSTYGMSDQQLQTALDTSTPLFGVNETCLAACNAPSTPAPVSG